MSDVCLARPRLVLGHTIALVNLDLLIVPGVAIIGVVASDLFCLVSILVEVLFDAILLIMDAILEVVVGLGVTMLLVALGSIRLSDSPTRG
jgi:hypothetical protein